MHGQADDRRRVLRLGLAHPPPDDRQEPVRANLPALTLDGEGLRLGARILAIEAPLKTDLPSAEGIGEGQKGPVAAVSLPGQSGLLENIWLSKRAFFVLI